MSSMDSKTANDEKLDMVMLEDNGKLKKLALLLYNNELQLMTTIASEPERAKHLKQCHEAYQSVLSLLDEANEMHEQQENEVKKSIAKDVLGYIKYGLNMSMQNIRNLSMRVGCVNKLQRHYSALVEQLRDLDTTNVTNVRRLAKDATDSKVLMWEYTTKCQSWVGRKASQTFSQTLKQEGIKFPELVNRTKNELGFEGKFESLEDAQKLEVYNSIIKRSGRAELPATDVGLGAAGVAVLVVTAAVMVWDIFTAEHELQETLAQSLSALQTVGEFAVQILVNAAVTEALVDLELGSVAIALAGFVAASVAGLIFGLLSGALIDFIIGHGGNTVPSLEGLKFHSVTMPNGMEFALQIAHDGP